MSFEILPIGSFFLTVNPTLEFVEEVKHVFILGTLIAAPFIALNFLINVSFAVLGKAVPQNECLYDKFCDSDFIRSCFVSFFNPLDNLLHH